MNLPSSSRSSVKACKCSGHSVNHSMISSFLVSMKLFVLRFLVVHNLFSVYASNVLVEFREPRSNPPCPANVESR